MPAAKGKKAAAKGGAGAGAKGKTKAKAKAAAAAAAAVQARSTGVEAPKEDKGSARHRNVESCVDQSVMRALRQHMACYGEHLQWSEIMVGEEGISTM